MPSGDKDRLLDHVYDGIQEYDNPLPGWWVWLFWATILFSVGYVVYYHLGPGPSILSEYEEEARVAQAQQARLAAVEGPMSDDALRALRQDVGVMTSGQEIFATRCAACHGQKGEGLIGPNLTDEYWLHGARPSDIYRVIAEGVPDKGMVPWKGQLRTDDLKSITAYVLALQGTHPPNAKPPQGTKATGEKAPGS
jgi:cytochrome c oxidase cbb3-type subunit 3